MHDHPFLRIVKRTGKKTLQIIGTDCLTATNIQCTRVKVGLVEIIILYIIHTIDAAYIQTSRVDVNAQSNGFVYLRIDNLIGMK